ncbi:flagellar protein FlaG [Anoxybacillus ayderensis]|uniref:flagellar protein FlaG n=1 Tax=Anoxybacillus ayderensis TaxID=265546 RepID=UPI000A2700AD|nr:flagellar protein FlaG [Anoxybacillus ayderensis]MBA2877267.1 flagellar protein FlaG [Anoxybacillus ayderensis]OSX53150.1 flagellar biosynthesis protein FlaG [Anoxybacillus ayderensis]
MIERISSSLSSTYMYEKTVSEKTTERPTEQPKQEQTTLQQLNAKQEEDRISKEKLEEIVKGMNEFLQPSHTSLKFNVHEDLKEYYVQLIDERTKEVVREIPPKKLLDMYAAMMKFVGLIVDRKI